MRHSGAAGAIALDLGMAGHDRPEITEWTNIVPVVQRDTPGGGSRQHAIDTAVALFHRHERDLDAALSDLAARHPAVAAAMRESHAGSVSWVAEERVRGLPRYQPRS